MLRALVLVAVLHGVAHAEDDEPGVAFIERAPPELTKRLDEPQFEQRLELLDNALRHATRPRVRANLVLERANLYAAYSMHMRIVAMNDPEPVSTEAGVRRLARSRPSRSKYRP